MGPALSDLPPAQVVRSSAGARAPVALSLHQGHRTAYVPDRESVGVIALFEPLVGRV